MVKMVKHRISSIFLAFISALIQAGSGTGTENKENFRAKPPSSVQQRPWCPSFPTIYPCTCDGPEQFPLLTCDKLRDPSLLNRVFFAYFPLLDFGKFTLTNSEVTVLPKNLFRDVRFEYIFVKKNPLRTIESGTFDRSRNTLKRLEIVHNDLESFPFGDFTGFRKLEYLELTYNSLDKISDYAFGYNPQLKSINLSFNKINYVGAMAFKELPRLENLELSFNQLTVINNLAFYSSKPNPRLNLDLAHNRIILIADNAFQNQVPANLNLTGNHLKKFKQKIFADMLIGMVQSYTGQIYVADNRFRCTCDSVGWLVRLSSLYKRHITGFTCSDLDNRKLEELSIRDVGCRS